MLATVPIDDLLGQQGTYLSSTETGLHGGGLYTVLE